MTKKEFLLSLDELLELDPGTLAGPEKLEDLAGWDSFSMVTFMGMAKTRSNVIVVPKQMATCQTVEDLAALLPLEG